MPTKNIIPTKIPLNDDGVAISSLTLVTSGDVGAFDYSGSDLKTILCFKNTGSTVQPITILKGNGIQGTADMAISLKAAETRLFNIESGKFKQVSGENKGKVLFTVPTGIVEAAAYLMP